jgi:hypothetical protein
VRTRRALHAVRVGDYSGCSSTLGCLKGMGGGGGAAHVLMHDADKVAALEVREQLHGLVYVSSCTGSCVGLPAGGLSAPSCDASLPCWRRLPVSNVLQGLYEPAAAFDASARPPSGVDLSLPAHPVSV